jgi:peptidyl-prolyl cis-trans isomerase A (cyclophilin A)
MRIVQFMLIAAAFAGCPTWAQEAPAPAETAGTTSEATTPAAPPPATVDVIIRTTLGAIEVAIETERAPLTAVNFLRYVDQKRLDGTAFYRAMKVGDDGKYGLMQGGSRGDPKRVLKAIAHEPTSTTGLSHVSGAISMARAAPGTATGDFFIVVGDLISLDAQPPNPADAGADTAGYAVFGRVIGGMDVVRAMLELPRTDKAPSEAMKGQMLAVPLKIVSVRRSGQAPPGPQAPAKR